MRHRSGRPAISGSRHPRPVQRKGGGKNCITKRGKPPSTAFVALPRPSYTRTGRTWDSAGYAALMASEHTSPATFDLAALIEQRRYSPRMRKALLRLLYGQTRHEAATLER